jgi:multidrug efflux pump subunit AcrA (membrane-fusion protein)
MSDPIAALHRFTAPAEPLAVVLIGFERLDADALRARLARLGQRTPIPRDLEVLVFPTADAEAARLALGALGGGRGPQIAVVCLGERYSGEEARRLIAGHQLDEALAALSPSTPPTPSNVPIPPSRPAAPGSPPGSPPPSGAAAGPPPLHIVAAAGPDPQLFQDLIAEDRIYYLSQRPPAPDELAALIGNAVRLYEARRDAAALPQGTPAAGAPPGHGRLEISEVLRALALQANLGDRAEVLAEAAREAVDAQRAYCLLYDPHDDTLWTRDRATGGERRDSAAVGIASFVLRSGLGLLVPRAGRDARYDREADDPEGDGSERLIAVPVRDEDGRVLAVLVAVRSAREAEFGAAQLEQLERLAGPAAPFLPPPRPEEVLGDDTLFRREALERFQTLDEAHDPLRISPSWTRWTYWSLLAALVAAVLFSLVGEVKEYASGLAVVWLGTRDDVTAEAGGTVGAVEVAPGQRVRPGQVLVRLHEAQEAAELARLDQEFELQLLNRLRDPSDPGPEQALIGLRTQRQLASERLGERTLRAPSAGMASDVRVRPGQYLTAGQPVLSIVRDQDRPTVVVLLPGEYRPLVRRGMPIRFEISGYRYAYQRLTVESVGDEVVGPSEARRYLGAEIGDSVQLTGPVVILRARLPRPTFQAEGRTYRFHNGMHGNAEVEVRSEKILLTLVPGLKALFRSGSHG